jgi:N-glycosylase/DNA lyase
MSSSPSFFDPDAPQVSLSLMARGLDLDATLTSGQAFSWKRTSDGKWRGWIDHRPSLVWLQGDALRAVGSALTRDAVSSYFNLDLPVQEIFATFPNDPWLEKAREFAPGLRILRQEPWETLCNFICSSLKQIVQIEQINHELRRAFGEEIGAGLHSRIPRDSRWPRKQSSASASWAFVRVIFLSRRGRWHRVKFRWSASPPFLRRKRASS